MALVNTLEKNEKLIQDIEKLKTENRVYKEIVDETKLLVEVLQVILPVIIIVLILYFISNHYSICYVFYCRNKLKMIGII